MRYNDQGGDQIDTWTLLVVIVPVYHTEDKMRPNFEIHHLLTNKLHFMLAWIKRKPDPECMQYGQ